MKIKKHLPTYIIGLVIIVFDQLVKLIVTNSMYIAQEIPVIKNFFSIYYVKNTGAAFSFLTDQMPLLVIVSLFCIGLILSLIQKEKYNNKLSYLSLGILLGGMFGNLIDRLFYNGVVDYLAFKIFSYQFPIFNIADIGITVGVFIYIVSILFEEINAKN